MTVIRVITLLCLVSGLSYSVPVQKPVSVDVDWWKTAVFYQIYPRSFKDSNNDGIGDLKGITSKLGHLKDAGITAAWLSPIYKSPQVDAGYDISDFRDIQEEYGTMGDFEELIREAASLGIKIVMDFVPNHSSDEHIWFTKSANREPGYENYYVWLDGRENNTKPPNNWVSHFSGPAWTYNEARNQWYLHQYARQQPDFNFREPRLVQEMKDVLTFWLDKGVAGFRVDTVPSLVEVGDFPDEPLSNDPNSGPNDYGYLTHPYTNDQPETFDMVYQWRALLDAYPGEGTRVMMTESYSEIHKVMEYYGNDTAEGAHFTFNFLFITDLNNLSSAQDMAMTIQKWMTYMPAHHTPNWVLGNHDQHRVATRYGIERADGLTMLHMLLPGVKIVYNGEEIAQEDGQVTFAQGKDPQGCNAGPERYQMFTRDPERTPIQWDDSINAGFNTGAETWLPVSDKYKEINLAKQNQPDADSHYNVFKKVLALRAHKTLQKGDWRVEAASKTVILLKRELEGSETYVCAFNLGSQTETVDLRLLHRLPPQLRIEVASVGSAGRVGKLVLRDTLNLGPFEALVMVTLEPQQYRGEPYSEPVERGHPLPYVNQYHRHLNTSERASERAQSEGHSESPEQPETGFGNFRIGHPYI